MNYFFLHIFHHFSIFSLVFLKIFQQNSFQKFKINCLQTTITTTYYLLLISTTTTTTTIIVIVNTTTFANSAKGKEKRIEKKRERERETDAKERECKENKVNEKV